MPKSAACCATYCAVFEKTGAKPTRPNPARAGAGLCLTAAMGVSEHVARPAASSNVASERAEIRIIRGLKNNGVSPARRNALVLQERNNCVSEAIGPSTIYVTWRTRHRSQDDPKRP